MHIKKFIVGPLGVNCVLISDEKTHQAVLIDPGNQSKKIIQTLQKKKLSLTHILLTHAHFDHIGALGAVKEACGGAVCLCRLDEPLYKSAQSQAGSFGFPLESEPPVIDCFLKDGDVLSCGRLRVGVLHTPGHSPGSVCFVVGSRSDLSDMSDKSNTWCDTVLCTGDTLFAGSVGRTDLGGNEKQLKESLKKLFTFPPDTRVIPGHGPETTVGEEKCLSA